jgi:hypothetical protein
LQVDRDLPICETAQLLNQDPRTIDRILLHWHKTAHGIQRCNLPPIFSMEPWIELGEEISALALRVGRGDVPYCFDELVAMSVYRFDRVGAIQGVIIRCNSHNRALRDQHFCTWTQSVGPRYRVSCGGQCSSSRRCLATPWTDTRAS